MDTQHTLIESSLVISLIFLLVFIQRIDGRTNGIRLWIDTGQIFEHTLQKFLITNDLIDIHGAVIRFAAASRCSVLCVKIKKKKQTKKRSKSWSHQSKRVTHENLAWTFAWQMQFALPQSYWQSRVCPRPWSANTSPKCY